jgi:protein-L-isoaspartate(D-aspartate) O-methyltransferase
VVAGHTRMTLPPRDGEPMPASGDDERWSAQREVMVGGQIEQRGIRSPAVLQAMRDVPRHAFVPPELQASAYQDHPLHIGHGQTISQPYIVALMTAIAHPKPADRALEVGTGCGYQAAVLSRIVSRVISVEVNEALHREATERLLRLGYANVTTVLGDGRQGWAEGAPYDVILVTAAPEQVPPALVEQLAPGGRLVIPVGSREMQSLELIEKSAGGDTRTTAVAPVMFVPLTGPDR